MCAVLRNDLEWKEDSWDSSNYFIGKKVLDCKVYQDEDTNSESIWVAMTLANQNGQEETMKLVAHSGNDAMPQGHYIVSCFCEWSEKVVALWKSSHYIATSLESFVFTVRRKVGAGRVVDTQWMMGVMSTVWNSSFQRAKMRLPNWMWSSTAGSSANLSLSVAILTVQATTSSWWQAMQTWRARRKVVFYHPIF